MKEIYYLFDTKYDIQCVDSIQLQKILAKIKNLSFLKLFLRLAFLDM